jgi:hypothetical protein
MRMDQIGPVGIFNWFKDDWLVSRQALKLFSISTAFVLATAPIFLGKMVLGNQSAFEQLLWGIEGVLGSISIFFLWFGMWRYWVRMDSSTGILKTTSFFLLLVPFGFGAVPYCFFAYRPQVIERTWARPFPDDETEETPLWGNLKKIGTAVIWLGSSALIFGLMLPKLIEKFGSEEYLYAYLTITSLLAFLLVIIFILGYPLFQLYRLGMNRRRRKPGQ